MVVERFAPSPTGHLHLGHAYSAWRAWRAAEDAGGRFLLRLEDLDRARCRAEFEHAIFEDLRWLGCNWTGDVLRQSSRGEAYARALAQLQAQGLVYACECSRRDIQEAASAPHEGQPIAGPDGPIYPGTCRGRGLPPGQGRAQRLDMAAAIAALGGARHVNALSFHEVGGGAGGAGGHIPLSADALIGAVGDAVLARRDGVIAYHLAVVADDAFQGVTHVTRGRDLFEATPLHRLLQALLDLPVPTYRHHALVRDEAGKRLAKRDDARAIARYRADGLSPDEVLRLAQASADWPD